MDGGGESVNLTRFDSCRSISASGSPPPSLPVCLCACVSVCARVRVLGTMAGIRARRVPCRFHRSCTEFVFFFFCMCVCVFFFFLFNGRKREIGPPPPHTHPFPVERHLNHEDRISSNDISSWN